MSRRITWSAGQSSPSSPSKKKPSPNNAKNPSQIQDPRFPRSFPSCPFRGAPIEAFDVRVRSVSLWCAVLCCVPSVIFRFPFFLVLSPCCITDQTRSVQLSDRSDRANDGRRRPQSAVKARPSPIHCGSTGAAPSRLEAHSFSAAGHSSKCSMNSARE